MYQETITKLNQFMQDHPDLKIKGESDAFISAPNKNTFHMLEEACQTANSQINPRGGNQYSEKRKALVALFSELFNDEDCRQYMMQVQSFTGKVQFYGQTNSCTIVNGVKDPQTRRDGIFITSFYMKQFIYDEIHKKIKELSGYLASINSREAAGANLFDPLPYGSTLASSLTDALLILNRADATFMYTGNFTYLTEQYQHLLAKYTDPANNRGLRSYSEQADYILRSIARGVLRPFDYIKTLITTGEWKAGSYEQDKQSGGTLATIKLPTFEGLNRFGVFVRQVEELLPSLNSIETANKMTC